MNPEEKWFLVTVIMPRTFLNYASNFDCQSFPYTHNNKTVN